MISKVFNFLKSIGLFNSLVLVLFLSNFYSYGHFFGYILIALIIIKANFIRRNLDSHFVILCLFSLIYGLFYSLEPLAGNQFIFIYIFTPPCLYLWGKYFASKSVDSIYIYYVLILVGIIFSIPGMISVLLDISQGGFVQATRNIPMFWGTEIKSATGMGMMFVFNMCIPAILLTSYSRISLVFKIILVTLFLLTLACVLRLGSRTQLVISIFTFLASLLYMMPKQSLKKNISLFTLLAIAIFFVFKNVSFDYDADWLNSFAGRMEKGGSEEIASGGGRTERWVKSLEYLFKKPLGWSVKEFGYSHNLWLDVLRAGGAISFFLLVIFSFKAYFQTKKVIALDSANIPFNALILNYSISLLLVFMVEPIIEGAFTLFVISCFFIGVMNKYLYMAQIQINRSNKII